MFNFDPKYDQWIVFLIGAIFFLPLLGGVHLFDWDENNFAECAREMIALGDYSRVHINYQPFWEKPPLFFWLQAAAMQLFGINEYAARFPNAICGIISLLFIFSIGRKVYNREFAAFWVLSYFGAILCHLYFKSGIIDPVFNLFIFASIWLLIQFHWKKSGIIGEGIPERSWAKLALGGAFLGLAILTKGPAALLIIGLVLFCYWVYQRFQFYINVPEFLWYLGCGFLVTFLWFGYEISQNGTWFTKEFITYQYRLFSTPDAGHGGFPGYHFVVLLIGCFPASIFAVASLFRKRTGTAAQKDLKIWMLILFWVVLILFSIVKSKIVHYSSLCYFPLTYFSALTLYHLKDKKINSWIIAPILVLGGIIACLFIALPFVGQNIDSIKPLFEKDPFAMANLDAEVSWSGIESFGGILLLVILSLFYFYQKKLNNTKAFAVLFIGMAIFINAILIFNINNIEHYSQRASIEFFKSKANEDCYIGIYGFKSYGYLFYSEKPPKTHPKSHDLSWLLVGDIDKQVYIVSKIHRVKELAEHQQLKEIYRKNGFVFLKRE